MLFKGFGGGRFEVAKIFDSGHDHLQISENGKPFCYLHIKHSYISVFAHPLGESGGELEVELVHEDMASVNIIKIGEQLDTP